MCTNVFSDDLWVYIHWKPYIILWADSPEKLKRIECGPQTVQSAQYPIILVLQTGY